jgi:glycosyltransferase involved in cell wall biosynthesis
MKNVAIFFPLTSYGGVQTCVISLIKGLNNINIIPDIIWDEEPNIDIILENKLKVNFKPIKFKLKTSIKNKLPNFLRIFLLPLYTFKTSKLEGKYDFYYYFSTQVIHDLKFPHLYYLSFPPKHSKLIIGSPLNLISYKISGFIYEIFYKKRYPVYELNSQIENYVINSQFTANLFEEVYHKSINVIYPPNAIESFLKKEVFIEGKEKIVFISRIVPYKRPEMVINLAKKYPNKQFKIIGAVSKNRLTYLKKLKDEVRNNSMRNVEFLINLPYNAVIQELLKAKIYIFPGINEHFGITTVEAMLLGAIPLVHKSGGQLEIVPWLELQFEDSELETKFNRLISLSDEEIIELKNKIFKHSRNFTEEVYIEKMIKYIL